MPAAKPTEPRVARLRRHGHHTARYTWAVALVAPLIVVIALMVANTRQVKLSWVVDTSHASLVWIILASAVLRRLAHRGCKRLRMPPGFLSHPFSHGPLGPKASRCQPERVNPNAV